jgi:hypothetical protein
MEELVKSGEKFTPDDVIAIAMKPDGSLVWLEKGNARAGIQHILHEHANQFINVGIQPSQLPDFLMTAVTHGKIVGIQKTRPIYEVLYQGKMQRVAIDIGSNGFIVSANPKSIPK